MEGTENNIAVTVSKRTFVNMNIIAAEVSDTGYQGGDAGHGCFVSLRIKDLAGTCMEVNGERVDEFTITFRGDSERKTLAEALDFAARMIKANGI